MFKTQMPGLESRQRTNLKMDRILFNRAFRLFFCKWTRRQVRHERNLEPNGTISTAKILAQQINVYPQGQISFLQRTFEKKLNLQEQNLKKITKKKNCTDTVIFYYRKENMHPWGHIFFARGNHTFYWTDRVNI